MGAEDIDEASTQKRVRKSIRLHPDTVQQVDYWRGKSGLAENEFFVEAIEEKIARMNGDYNVPDLFLQRMNQLIDEVRANSTTNANLERVVTSGFDSLLGMARGDVYLADDESGELLISDDASAITGG